MQQEITVLEALRPRDCAHVQHTPCCGWPRKEVRETCAGGFGWHQTPHLAGETMADNSLCATGPLDFIAEGGTSIRNEAN